MWVSSESILTRRQIDLAIGSELIQKIHWPSHLDRRSLIGEASLDLDCQGKDAAEKRLP